MRKQEIFVELDMDFEIAKYCDVWGRFEEYIHKLEKELSKSFLESFTGIMIDRLEEVDEIITATFITDNLFQYIKDNKKRNVLIFAHHPFYQKVYDYSWHDSIFKNLDIINQNKISIYICHLALDFHIKNSTAYYFAKELILNPTDRLKYKYQGVEGEVECEYYGKHKNDFEKRLNTIKSDFVFYQFSEKDPEIICCSPGGGNMLDHIELAKEKGVDTYITGISEYRGKNSISRNKSYFQELERIGLNIIGLGHYQTEALAMKGLVDDYFNKFNHPASYFEDNYYK